jgi:hypothetical protein
MLTYFSLFVRYFFFEYVYLFVTSADAYKKIKGCKKTNQIRKGKRKKGEKRKEKRKKRGRKKKGKEKRKIKGEVYNIKYVYC